MALFATRRTNADRFAADVRNLVTHADDVLRMTANYSGEKIANARERLGEKVAQMRDTVEHAQSTAATQSKHAVRATNSYVRKHPWQALGIGLAVGATIGLMGLWSTRR